MNAFTYREARLHAEDADLGRLASEIGTPFYCYSTAAMEERYRRLAEAVAASGTGIAYAVKANANPAVIGLFRKLGAGADVVSEGEIRRAQAAGMPAERIVFSGVGKSRDELALAIAAGIRQINVESETEFRRICALAAETGTEARVAFRVNPDVEAGGHDKISTGRRTDKFGLAPGDAVELYRSAVRQPHVRPVGLAIHIGSQIRDVSAFAAAFDRLVELANGLRAEGLECPRLDLGGGLGIAYRDGERDLPLAPYAALLADVAKRTGAELVIEPGRWLVASAGVLVTEVNTVKTAGGRRIVIVDAAMNDLIRPTLYDAHHPVWPVREAAGAALEGATVAGPVCESGDVLAVDAPLPVLEPGDLLAIGHAGAYGAVMSSGYNGRLLVPEVLVDGARAATIRRRPSHAEAMALEGVPGPE